jgi:hypothetical protein
VLAARNAAFAEHDQLAARNAKLERILAEIRRARIGRQGLATCEAIGCGLNHWDGLVRFLDAGRIEIDSNTVERSIRPIVLTRKLGNRRIPDRDM